ASRACCSTATLTVILYGKLSLFDPMGDLIGRNGLFLLDPIGCDRVVRYMNPHRLSSLDPGVVWTAIEQPGFIEPMEYLSNAVDFFNNFETGEDLAEAEGPAALRTCLLK